MDEDSASTLLQTARLTHRVGLIICATMMLVLSTHYFDATTRTRTLFDRLGSYAKEFEENNPCRYTEAEIEAEIESRTRLDFSSVTTLAKPVSKRRARSCIDGPCEARCLVSARQRPRSE